MTRKLGDATLTMVNAGDFRLDGGAMHGVVPKPLWNKLVSCDEHNRCTYSTNSLLIELDGRRILIETGNGDKFSPKYKDLYGIDHDRAISDALSEIGVEPESIDIVIFTHLHFDHAGGATTRRGDEVVPVFPRAKHYIQAAELRAARTAHERNRASYLAENYEPLAAAGLLREVEGEQEIMPGLRLLPTTGHSSGHQSVLIGHPGEQALFLGDVMPTRVHVPLPWIMGYDLDVEGTLASKRTIHERALAENWLLLFGHDRDCGAYLDRDERGRIVAGPPVEL